MHCAPSNRSLFQLGAIVAFATGTLVAAKAASNPVITTIRVGTEAAGIVAAPKSQLVYVAQPLESQIGVIDAKTNELSSAIDVAGGEPVGLAISPDGTNLYATLFTAGPIGLLEEISAKTGEVLLSLPVGSGPQIPAVSPDESVICVPNIGDGTVSIFSPDFEGPVTINGQPLQAVFLSDSLVLVTNETTIINEIDTSSGTVPKTFNAPTPIVGVVLTKNHKTLYAAGENAVYAFDLASGQFTTIPVSTPTNPTLGVPALSANGEFLYVPVLESNMTVGLSVVIVIDTKTNAVVGNPIPVGKAPIQIAMDGKVGYVSNEISGTVTVIKIQ
jgi:DNA-binding beta-propeller fold protein YncE